MDAFALLFFLALLALALVFSGMAIIFYRAFSSTLAGAVVIPDNGHKSAPPAGARV